MPAAPPRGPQAHLLIQDRSSILVRHHLLILRPAAVDAELVGPIQLGGAPLTGLLRQRRRPPLVPSTTDQVKVARPDARLSAVRPPLLDDLGILELARAVLRVRLRHGELFGDAIAPHRGRSGPLRRHRLAFDCDGARLKASDARDAILLRTHAQAAVVLADKLGLGPRMARDRLGSPRAFSSYEGDLVAPTESRGAACGARRVGRPVSDTLCTYEG